jgi:hypothetical protein
MGGLFQAQNQQLEQLMPNYTAAPTATGIGSGQFGSLRNQTAANQEMGDAQAALFAQQMQAALQNQQTGVSAGTGLSNVGTQGTQAMTTLGQAQQSDPFTAAANYGKIVGGITAPTTVSNRTQLSPLNTIGSLVNAGSGVMDSLFGKAAGSAATGLLGNTGFADWWKGLNPVGSDTNPVTIDSSGGTNQPVDYSDIRMKENISKVGVLPSGLNVYKFEYKPEFKDLAGHGEFVGVMAQDVEKTYPEAVSISPEGYKMVDYSKIGIDFKRVN